MDNFNLVQVTRGRLTMVQRLPRSYPYLIDLIIKIVKIKYYIQNNFYIKHYLLIFIQISIFYSFLAVAYISLASVSRYPSVVVVYGFFDCASGAQALDSGGRPVEINEERAQGWGKKGPSRAPPS